MMKTLTALALIVVSALAAPHARAWDLYRVDPGVRWFTGTTEELFEIRAAMTQLHGGFPSSAYLPPYSYVGSLIQPPFGLGDVDCMEAYAFPGEFYDTTSTFLGQSVSWNGKVVQIPAYGDLINQDQLPGACYGYLFALWCTEDPWMRDMMCPDLP
jgi:hypothetical protein